MNSILKYYFLFLLSISLPQLIKAQCCAGGSGSPIAGGASQGVLLERQIELNTNFQFISTNKFYSRDALAPDSTRTFDSFSSTYEYFRLAYGVTKNLTMSVESGYYLHKKEIGLNNNPATTYTSKGIGDLILFPRYDVINWTEENHRTEVTVGMGIKIPLGSFNDSFPTYPEVPAFPGQVIYNPKPQSIQLSSGANDFIFYTFFFREYTKQNFKIFANAMYIKKGYNPNGEKLGDFASVGLFFGKSFFNHLGITLQARYELIDTMKINENTFNSFSSFSLNKPSTYSPDATGSKKVYFTPQVSYTKGKFTIYISSDFPVYQFINSSPYYTQVGSQHQTTVGLSFRFFAVRPLMKSAAGKAEYYCPMHPEVTSSALGKCPKCGMDLIIH